MKGSILMGGTLLVAAAMGAGLWYSSNSAYYYEVNGLTEVAVGDAVLPVSDYRGIDADTSPLKMRACFTANWDIAPDAAGTDGAQPLIAPTWFDCFDAKQLTADLQSGAATVLLSNQNKPYGFDTFIARYPDGRAFMWRQINACGEAQFSGGDLPEGCPDPDAARARDKTGAVLSEAVRTAEKTEILMEERT